MIHLRRLLKALRSPSLGILFALIVCSIFLTCTGEDPWLLVRAFGNTFLKPFGIGYALFYATPLIATGLSVALSFKAGLFNIGAEGQLYIGSIAVVIVSRSLPFLPPFLAIPVGIIAAFAAGALWGAIAGILKAWRGSHEVIVTILLNFIAVSLVDYLLLYPLRNPQTQNTETLPVPPAYEIANIVFLPTTPANYSIVLMVAVSIATWFFLYRTTWGYELRSVGLNATAARFAGISVKKITVTALALSGGLAGLVGVNEVMGNQHKVLQGFSPGYGFTGIAVALIAKNNPIAIIISAVLFGGLQTSSREIEFLSDRVSKELSFVIQGVLIAFVAAEYLVNRLLKSRQLKGAKP